ncbi:MAG: SIMPL domain-containing protein [Calditrichaeota bacterium]|nr:SIMPL domain-containing protein [Calditrichota bacterium]
MQKILPILIVVVFCMALPALSKDYEERRIVVTGSAEIVVPADNVTFSFTTRFESDDIDEAIRNVRGQAETISNDLINLKLTKNNLSTGNFNSGQIHYRKEDRYKEKPEFYASLTIIVDMDNLDLLEPAIVAVSKRRPNDVSNVNYNLKNFEEHKLQALAKALEMAKVKADILAEGSGVKVGKVLYVDENKSSGVSRYAPNPFNSSMQISSESSSGGGSFHQRSAKISASVKLIVGIED